jgi:hypothetical protein
MIAAGRHIDAAAQQLLQSIERVRAYQPPPMTTGVQNYRFVDEPVAGESAQFPLSRGSIASAAESPSPKGVRPWALGG